jgi:benzoyl-CoA-dihydrodiol lyase
MAKYFDFPPVDFETHPSRYKHWDLDFDGDVAKLSMHIKEDGPLWDGQYELKLNSYDLGVDIELNDAVTRLRFEHPEVRAVLLTGAYDKIFCAGANIRMLGMAPHAFKVNFCKYTNETRVGIEDATRNSGQMYLAALNGTASGGGYELALACERIYLIDDGNAAVSLPEVPLLGVLPGTGGLTRLTDKRKIRRDMADVFCTKAEGFRARDAKKYDFVDDTFSRSKWDDGMAAAARKAADEMAAAFPLRTGPGVALPALERSTAEDGWSYKFVTVRVEGRVAHVTFRGPDAEATRSADTWALRAFRELEDALLHLRVNNLDVGVLILRTEGDPDAVLAADTWLNEGRSTDWFLEEVHQFQARTLRKLDNMAKSVFALIEEGHCFVGSVFEMALAADRSYMFMDDDDESSVRLNHANSGIFAMANGLSRLAARYPGNTDAQAAVMSASAQGPITADDAGELGLVTAALDDIDYDDEVRIAIEERVSLSPDALTGMEQNLRFGGVETCETKIYGRLSAWQNWIFQRPNAVGDRGALTLYGHPERPVFDYKRT